MSESSWYRDQYNALENERVRKQLASDAAYRAEIQARSNAIKQAAQARIDANIEANRARIADNLAEANRSASYAAENAAKNRAALAQKYSTIEVPDGRGGYVTTQRTPLQAPQLDYLEPTRPTPQPKPAYSTDAQPNFSQPVNQSPISATPQPSIARSIGTGIAQLGAGYAGDYLGDRTNEAIYGRTDGIASQLGTVIGVYAGATLGGFTLGGITGGTGAVAGSIAGAGFGSFVGNVIGGGIDAIGNFFFGKKPSISDGVDVGKNYNKNAQIPYTPPFTGGQMTTATYGVNVSQRSKVNGVQGDWIKRNSNYEYYGIRGAILGARAIVVYDGSRFWTLYVQIQSSTTGWHTIGESSASDPAITGNVYEARVDSVLRSGGLPDSLDNLPDPSPFTSNLYTTANAPNPTPASTISDAERAANKEINDKLDSLLKNDVDAKLAKEKIVDRLGYEPDTAKRAANDASPKKEPEAPPKPDPNSSKLDEILQGITNILANTGLIIGITTGIAAAVAGVAATLAAMGITLNVIISMLSNILAQIGAVGSLVSANFVKLFAFLDLNSKVESVKTTIMLALTLHNALMLSQSLGTTLGSILDNVLGVFGNTFKTSEGSAISVTSYLGATVQSWIIGVIGAENYVKLSETLAVANRIYQTGMNIVSTMQGILDSASGAIQATGINVSRIGNALRDDGVVNRAAFPYMDESALGTRAASLERFTQLTTTISDLDSKAQNLVTITAAPITIKDSIKQSKEDIKAFNDAKDLNSQANLDAKQAKLDVIKALKPITEATISRKDDDT